MLVMLIVMHPLPNSYLIQVIRRLLFILQVLLLSVLRIYLVCQDTIKYHILNVSVTE
jgi:hypothetical protein